MLDDLENDSQFNQSENSINWDSQSLIFKSKETIYNF